MTVRGSTRLAQVVVALMIASPAGALAAAAPDTTVRVPGAGTLRFGLSSETLQQRGFLVEPEGGQMALQADTRFFGLDAHAVLRLEDERLAQARFEVAAITERQLEWLEDELRRMGFARRCEQHERGRLECEYSGRGAVVAVSASGGQLTADVERLEPATSPVAGAVPPNVTAAEDTTRTPCWAPDTLVTRGAASADPTDSTAIAPPFVHRLAPPYPARARQAGVQGRVWVLAEVDERGRVIDARILRGIAELNEAALAAVRAWSFEPLVRGGRPCRFRVELPVLFSLH